MIAITAHRCLVATLIMLAAVLSPRLAAAHGGGPGLDYDPCARYAGIDNYVHFSAYQPQYNRFAEYCGNLPRGGKTLLVFDLVGPELLRDRVAVAIVPEGGTPTLSLPAQRYPAGVIDLETTLDPGHYDALLTIGETPTVYHVNFDVAVGSWWQPLIAPFVVASLILLVAIGYCIYQARALAGEARSLATSPVSSIKSA